jgi:hypothetical protein
VAGCGVEAFQLVLSVMLLNRGTMSPNRKVYIQCEMSCFVVMFDHWFCGVGDRISILKCKRSHQNWLESSVVWDWRMVSIIVAIELYKSSLLLPLKKGNQVDLKCGCFLW